MKLKELKDKENLYTIIFESDTPLGKKFDVVLIIAIFVSIVFAFLESVRTLPLILRRILEVGNFILTALFTLEYAARVYCSPDRKKYILSFFGVIDLLAILPPYLFVVFPTARYMLLLRSFRFIRIFRIFRLFSFINEGFLMMQALRKSLHKIAVYFMFVLILVTCLGTLMYIVESGQPNTKFTNIGSSVYWAIVTMTTVGYGDITPVTAVGRLLSAFVMLLGYTIIAIPTGIVSANFIDVTNKKAENGRCPRCGEKIRKGDRYCSHCGEKL